MMADTPEYIRQCALQYAQPWTLVRRNYAHLTQARHTFTHPRAMTSARAGQAPVS